MQPKHLSAEPLNRNELINALATDVEITQAQSQLLLRSTLRELRKVMVEGQAVSIPLWGTFDTAIHQARRGYLPSGFKKSGAGYAILPKKRVPVFRTAESLRQDVYDIDPEATEGTEVTT